MYELIQGEPISAELKLFDEFDNLVNTNNEEIIVECEGHNILEGQTCVQTVNGMAYFDKFHISKVSWSICYKIANNFSNFFPFPKNRT